MMVHMTGRSGFSMADPMMPVKGLALYLVMSAVLATALRIANLKTWGQRACLVSVLGLAAAVSIDIGDGTWRTRQAPPPRTDVSASFHVGACVRAQPSGGTWT